MDNINCYIMNYNCSGCGFERSFSERIDCAVKKCHCNHFDIVIVTIKTGFFKMTIKFRCNICNKIKEIDLSIGRYFNNILKAEDFCCYQCCGNQINLFAFLSEEYFNFSNLNNNGNLLNNNYNYYNQPQINMGNQNYIGNINYDYFNYNPSRYNNNLYNNNFDNIDNNDNNMNNNSNNNNNLSSVDRENIVDFKMKNWKLIFEDKRKEKEGKKYEIYTTKNTKFIKIINDLKEDYPDLVFNPQTHSLSMNGNILNVERNCSQNNVPSNSTIYIEFKK